MKCDVIDWPFLLAIAVGDPQPIRTILASLLIGLPPHVTDAATVLVNGRPVADRECFGMNDLFSSVGPGLLSCVHVKCYRLLGGMPGSALLFYASVDLLLTHSSQRDPPVAHVHLPRVCDLLLVRLQVR